MKQEDEAKTRLLKRLWLRENFDLIMDYAVYYRAHKEDLKYPRVKWWDFDEVS